MTSTRLPTRSPSWTRPSPRPARRTSSTATRAPGTRSSPSTGPLTGWRPPTTAGRGSGTSTTATWPAEEALHVYVPDREDRGRGQRQGRGGLVLTHRPDRVPPSPAAPP